MKNRLCKTLNKAFFNFHLVTKPHNGNFCLVAVSYVYELAMTKKRLREWRASYRRRWTLIMAEGAKPFAILDELTAISVRPKVVSAESFSRICGWIFGRNRIFGHGQQNRMWKQHFWKKNPEFLTSSHKKWRRIFFFSFRIYMPVQHTLSFYM
jgi:hypothetical protein